MCHARGVGRWSAQGDPKDLIGVVVFNGDVFRAGRLVAVDFDRAIELGDLLFSKEYKIIFHEAGDNTQGAVWRQCYSVRESDCKYSSKFLSCGRFIPEIPRLYES